MSSNTVGALKNVSWRAWLVIAFFILVAAAYINDPATEKAIDQLGGGLKGVFFGFLESVNALVDWILSPFN